MRIWRIKSKGNDARFRSGHPWAYSNELQESPKGIEPGEPIELCDAGGKFLARGYGNSHSLIAFRALSRDPAVADPTAPEQILRALLSAGELRARLGLSTTSHRVCFGEADQLPGLVIDLYILSHSQSHSPPADAPRVFAVQLHTAGMNRLRADLPGILESYSRRMGIPWDKTSVILRNDLSVRKLEGLEVEEPTFLRRQGEVGDVKIRVSGLDFSVDLLRGQKTGFFLDQTANIEMAIARLSGFSTEKNVRVLDICSYVGQWGAGFARALAHRGVSVHVTAADASAQALERARANVESQGASFEALKMDVLSGLADLPERSFDIVICDPPALIQGRKDIPAGTHAYLQLNTQVFRIVKRPGAVVSCSCSSLLDEESFYKTLSKAAYRNRAQVRWIARGTQAPDHPVIVEFPEGRYLKCMIGAVT